MYGIGSISESEGDWRRKSWPARRNCEIQLASPAYEKPRLW
jgi:hypothetical protein